MAYLRGAGCAYQLNMSDFQRILVPIDFSEGSREAIRCALSLSRSSTTLTLLHVYEPPAAMEGIVPGADRKKDTDNERGALRAEMEALAAELGAKHTSQIQIALAEAPIVAAILNYAAAEKVEVIVMGSHGRTGLRRLLMGSIAEGVVRWAKCSVITVHSPATE